MRLPRFRIRTLMIAVAVLALGFGGAIEFLGPWAEYRRRGAFHTRMAMMYKSYARLDPHSRKVQHVSDGKETGTILLNDEQESRWPEMRAQYLREADWHTRLSQEYRRALWWPWLSLPPNPSPVSPP